VPPTPGPRQNHRDTHRRNSCLATLTLWTETRKASREKRSDLFLVPQVSNNSYMAAAPSTVCVLLRLLGLSGVGGASAACTHTHTHTHTHTPLPPSLCSGARSLPLSAHSASLWLVGSQWDKTLSVISASWVPRVSLIILQLCSS
jgi:hypothetical protein